MSELASCFVLNAAWQVPVVVAAGWAGERCLRHAAGRWQHAWWGFCLLLAVALPWTTAAWPEPPATIPTQEAAAVNNVVPVLAVDWSRQRLSLPVPERTGLAVGLLLTVACLWRVIQLARALAAARSWRNAAGRAVPARVLHLQRGCEAALDLPPVETRAGHAVVSPLTLGVWRPVILLPREFGFVESDDVLRAAVGHELAHVRRRDYGWNLFYEALLLPLGWHPVLWLLRRQLDRTRELACDELVAAKVLEPRRYARSLVAIAESAVRRDAAWSPALGITDGGILRQRVARLMSGQGSRLTKRAATAALALLAVVGVVSASGYVRATGMDGDWSGGAGPHVYTVRLNGTTGSIERTVRTLRPVPLLPPPAPGVLPATGRFQQAVRQARSLRFGVMGPPGRATEYEFRWNGDETAVLFVRSGGKLAFPAAVPLVRIK